MRLEMMILYTTLRTQQEAEKLARLVLDEKLAACVNIIPSGISLYMWEGKLEQQSECYLLCKTLPEQIEVLKTFILTHHPYKTPALLIWTAETTPEFLAYLHTT